MNGFESVVSNPDVIFALVIGGIVCLFLELIIPGFGIFGLLGLGSTGVALFSTVHYLDSWVVFGLMVVAVGAMLVQLAIQDIDWYSGVSVLVVILISGGLGVYFLDKYFDVSMEIVYVTVGILGAIGLGFLYLSRTVSWKEEQTGKLGKVIVGKDAIVLTELAPTGRVVLKHGFLGRAKEEWIATAAFGDTIKEGEEVKVVSIYGELLKVARK